MPISKRRKMASPSEKLAASLAQLESLQGGGRRVFQSRELSRVHRERLVRQGFLRHVKKGWLISTGPGTDSGDSTPWYASFWEFCARYCGERFGDRWHLSPEQSLLLHAENTVIPRQVIICAPKGSNNTIDLLFGTSLYDLKQARMPAEPDLTLLAGLRLYTRAAALIKVSEAFFRRWPLEAHVVLAGIRDASDLLVHLLGGGHSTVAGRLAGAFRRVGCAQIAEEILRTMKAAGYDVRETNPFLPEQAFGILNTREPPIVGRIEAMWGSLRESVIEAFPPAPGLPKDNEAYLQFVDAIYESDAYHSLSIEGYRVTPELIQRVQTGNWNPDNDDADRQSRDALAARGYWETFQLVKETVAKIVVGENAGTLVRSAHREWYRALFQPCVRAGVIEPSALAGYRSDVVFLRGSRHVPPRWEAVRAAMPALFDLLEEEREPSVRAVLGHWLFGYVHPYPDGNGRMARFVMNAMLASGGYPWTVIRVEDREGYLSALESANLEMNIRPFATFLAMCVQLSLEQAGH
ncbi:MAG: Fic family protein [Gemmatimonadales bacterium]